MLEAKMRIAITTLTTSSQPLGVGRYLISLLDALQKIDDRNQYLIYTSQDNYHLFNLWADNFSEIRTPFLHDPRLIMRPAYFLWQNTWFLWSLRQKKVDVLHLPNLLPLFFDIVPTVVTIHDLGEFKVKKKYGKMRLWYRQKVLPIVVQNARRVIAVSNNTKTDLNEILNVPLNKIDVTYEGANNFLSLKSGTLEKERFAIEKYSNTSYIFFAGAMYKHKNLKRLMQAFHQLKVKQNIPHKLVITGKKGGEYENLLLLSKKLNIEQDVIFTGYVSDYELQNLYSHASIVGYVPLNEGFGLPVLEAMANGVPVVTSNISSLPEIAGEAAILVDPFNIQAIADALFEVLNDKVLRDKLVAKGYQRVKLFSWENCAQETLRSYIQAAGYADV